ncbi:MAG: drug/metabolite transporter (DMT)-like permease [Gammaproteobacteria bacterium]|jgi:drug/metabolite transporter (DMT)-like permease
MTPLVVGLVLLAALLHASWNAMAKSGGTPEFSIASYQLVGALICLPLLFFVPLPLAASWPMILISVVVHNFYYFTLAKSYRAGDLSQMYPLFRGLAPVLVAVGAMVFAQEWLSFGSMLGIALISFGLISITLLGGQFGQISPVALRWGLATSVLIASYTVADGMGVRVAGNSLSYILWLFVLEVVPIGLVLLRTRKIEWFAYLRNKPGKIIIGGIASSAAYGLVIFAMGLGSMAMVSSLRETSVIFAALIGTLVFRESFGRQRIIAATLVCFGIIMIRWLG